MKCVLLYSLLIGLLLCCSCGSNKKAAVDDFYTEKGEWDSARLPLVKPYEAIIVNKEAGWGMNLVGVDGDTGFFHIKKATVVNGVILVYYENDLLHGETVWKAWYVVIPAKKIEKGFSTHKQYTDYLDSIHIPKETPLHDIEAIADYYEYHDTIDWKEIH
ncbi:hypothetical protein AAFN85_24675 [Mucilaginibacter sp. CAU 1740]|uniref:hypothetical protein n=1 Tax=Mucilaginibacter sp. CAU 1740 TaxID=3140365 RepID=UPI00325AEE3A